METAYSRLSKRMNKLSRLAKLIAWKAFLILIFCLLSCVKGSPEYEKIKEVDFLFDGGSVVFSLPKLNLKEKHLMISPVREINHQTGEIKQMQGVKISLVSENSERFFGERLLGINSQEEKIVLSYLSNCRNILSRRKDPWAYKLDTLIKLIKNRNMSPPEVYFWK